MHCALKKYSIRESIWEQKIEMMHEKTLGYIVKAHFPKEGAAHLSLTLSEF